VTGYLLALTSDDLKPIASERTFRNSVFDGVRVVDTVHMTDTAAAQWLRQPATDLMSD